MCSSDIHELGNPDHHKDSVYIMKYAERCEKMDAICRTAVKKILRACKERESEISNLKAVANNPKRFETYENDEEHWRFLDERMESYDDIILHSLNLIYNASCAVATFSGDISEGDARSERYEKFGRNLFGIEAKKVGEKILVTLPLLARRPKPAKSGVGLFYDYTNIFAEDILWAMTQILPEIRPEFSEFYTKTLSFFYVYNDQNFVVPDSDNRDTKCIIDAITGVLPGGDSAFLCDFFHSAIINSELKEGTYVVVSKGKQMPQSEDDLLSIVRSAGIPTKTQNSQNSTL